MRRARSGGKLGIVFALEMEQRGLRHVLSESPNLVQAPVRPESETRTPRLSRWSVGDLEVLVAVSGVGRDRSAASTEWLIDSGARWVISAGFAAGLDPSYGVADIVAARRVLRDGTEPIHCGEALNSALPPSGTLGYSIHAADLLTVGEPILRAAEKTEIREATGADALDMESYAAAEACRRRGVQFAAVRAVSDAAHEDLPKEIAALVTASGLRRGLFVLSRPHIWPHMLRLRRQAQDASNSLGDVLGIMLLRLA